MTTLTPQELAARLGQGLLSFPVTHFAADLSVDESAYRENIAWLGQYEVAGLFAAGGTGEFFSLTPAEVEQVVAAAVQSAPESTPVLAPVGYGTATAIQLAQAAERAGAAGILLFPPYLTETSQDGLFHHVKAVCDATSLGVIVYNRANAIYADTTVARLAEACPTFVGFKDGAGDIDQMTRIFSQVGDRLLYVGGLPTAEMYALPYISLGLTTYSSAIFNFVPQFALDFYGAVRAGDHEHIRTALNDFVIPYCNLRNQGTGYAVSIVKAGMTAVGRTAGPVRPPITDLTESQLADLTDLVKKVS
ncbi:5-dehydro-4-deoxyglucarate dehydratase [Aeromicrobium sp. CF4.19]|uniref:5-dehydro-4-deoxyglucarate dehydratase n=1 Tax=Aeromicrobium sp. CF4.19 TaxID=3373082 RepID=UPI003EE71DE6